MARRDGKAKVRARQHREAAAKRKIQTALDPLAPDAQQRVVQRVLGADIPAIETRSEDRIRDLLQTSFETGVDEAFEPLDIVEVRVSTAVGDTIGNLLRGQPTTPVERAAALSEWTKIVVVHRDGVRVALDEMDVVREAIGRRRVRLEALLLRADLTNSFLPPSPEVGRIKVSDPRLRAVAYREPNLLDAGRAVARWIGRDEARAIFDKALEDPFEGAAFEADYMAVLAQRIVDLNPHIAEALGEAPAKPATALSGADRS